MKPKSVKVFAPASISNLGPGFDVFGIAINRPGDIVVAKRKKETGLSFSVITKDENVPLETKNNIAAKVAILIMEECKPSFGIELKLYKKMPIGSGLGSSAASSAAAAFAVNSLLKKTMKKLDLLPFVIEGERIASGSPHADNATPSLLGGAWLIRSYDPLDVIPLPIKNTIVWVVVHPHIIVHTREARNILPESITLKKAIHQWGNVSGLTAGLIQGNSELVGKCVEDVIVEPVRAKLIPGFYEVKHVAISSGALGCSISGSGPSMFAVASSMKSAELIGAAMAKTFKKISKVESDVYISRANMDGAKLLKEYS